MLHSHIEVTIMLGIPIYHDSSDLLVQKYEHISPTYP